MLETFLLVKNNLFQLPKELCSLPKLQLLAVHENPMLADKFDAATIAGGTIELLARLRASMSADEKSLGSASKVGHLGQSLRLVRKSTGSGSSMDVTSFIGLSSQAIPSRGASIPYEVVDIASLFNLPSMSMQWKAEDPSSDCQVGGGISFGKEPDLAEVSSQAEEEMSVRVSVSLFDKSFSMAATTADPSSDQLRVIESDSLLRCAGFTENLEVGTPGVDLNAYRGVSLANAEKYISFYRGHFHGTPHALFVGTEDRLGPIIVAAMKAGAAGCSMLLFSQFGTSMVQTGIEPGTRRLDAEIVGRALYRAAQKGYFSLATTQLVCCRDHRLRDELVELELAMLMKCYRVAVLFQRKGQESIDEMVANCEEDCSRAFLRFLRFLGSRVHLKGWKGYNGGLDTKSGADGETSIYCKWKDCDVMFIVPSLMPFDAYDPQQSRRRYAVEEAVVVLVFQEKGASLSPVNVASQYNHVLISLQEQPKDGNDSVRTYRMNCISRDDVPAFPPRLHCPPVFPKTKQFHDFLFTKIINGERSAYKSPLLARGMRRARKRMLQHYSSEFASGKLRPIVMKDSLDGVEEYLPSQPARQL